MFHCVQSCAVLQLESARPVGSFVKLSSSFLLTSQTMPSSTLWLLILFVPFCAIRLTPCAQSTGSHVGLQNVASHGYLLERYENHGIPNYPDQHETIPDLNNTVQHSVRDLGCRERAKLPRRYICVEKSLWGKVIGVMATPVCHYSSFALIVWRKNNVNTFFFF